MPLTNINIRVDSEIKIQAQGVFVSLGLDMTTAINIFLRQAIRQNGIPFAVSADPVKKAFNPDSVKGKMKIVH